MAGRSELEGDITRVDHTHGEVGPEPDEASVVDEVVAVNDWLRRGDTIGRYVVIECLGVGGMGIVYAAWDPKLDRKLAIKLVRTRGGAGETRGRTRLLREAQALARLRHPNVINVHDVGTHQGRVFVAMEFVEGTTLQRWLADTRERDFPVILDVFLQAGRGLAAAHRAGLIHRDFKPENVMLGADRRAMVLDFGIARTPVSPDEVARTESSTDIAVVEEPPDERVADDDEAPTQPRELGGPRRRGVVDIDLREHARAEDSMAGLLAEARAEDSLIAAIAEAEDGVLRPVSSVDHDLPEELPALAPEGEPDELTRRGRVVGTPGYMSPEQHRGQPLDGRSDQFSYCVAFWEALTGERPFGEGPSQKLLARMRLGQLRPFRRKDVPRHVVAALRRGLSWSRADRFPTMEALLEALNPRAEARRGPSLTIALTASFAALAVVAIASVPRAERASARPTDPCPVGVELLASTWNPTRATTLERAVVGEGGAERKATWTRIHDRLERWADAWIDARDHVCHAHHVERGSSVELHDRQVACLEQQRARFDRLLANLDAHARVGLDGLFDALAELPTPSRCTSARVRSNTPEPSSASDRQRLSELLSEAEQLETLLGLGRYEVARERAQQLVLAAEQLAHPPMLAKALLLRASLLSQGSLAEPVEPEDIELAEASLLRAAAIAAAVDEPEIQAEALIVLAGSLAERGLHDEARRWLALCEGLVEQTSEPLRLRVEIAKAKATIAVRQGRLELAEQHFEAALALLEAQPNASDDAQLPLVLQDLAALADAREQHERALELLRRALILLDQQAGPSTLRIALVRRDLAATLAKTGRLEAALDEHRRALAIFEAEHSRIHAALARAAIGVTLGALDRCADARPSLEQAHVDIVAAAPRTLAHAQVLEARALACDFSDQQALAWLDEARAIRTTLGPADHPDLLANQLAHGLALLVAGRAEDALVELGSVRERSDRLDARELGSLDAGEGLALHTLGRVDEATPLLARAAENTRPGQPLHARLLALRESAER